MKKKILYTLVTIIVIVGLYFTLPFLHSNTNKCPNDYSNDDEGYNQQVADIDAWTNAFFDEHPDASLSDWSKARLQFYIDNNCTEALQRYKDAKTGDVDQVRYQMVKDSIDKTTEYR